MKSRKDYNHKFIDCNATKEYSVFKQSLVDTLSLISNCKPLQIYNIFTLKSQIVRTGEPLFEILTLCTMLRKQRNMESANNITPDITNRIFYTMPPTIFLAIAIL
jgi:hypothetical protein